MAVHWWFARNPGPEECGRPPYNARNVEVMTDDGEIKVAQWACDLSGEYQPPFKGWFEDAGSYYRGIPTPMFWRDIPKRV